MPLDDLPNEFLSASQAKLLVSYIRSLPIPKRDKRYIFLAWCNRFGYNYTIEDMSEVTS